MTGHTGSMWWEPPTGTVGWSAEAYRLMDYPRSTAPSIEKIISRCHPDDMLLIRRAIAGAMRDGDSIDIQHRLLMPNGAVKHIRMSLQPVAAPRGETAFVGGLTDITEWKDSEEALSRARSDLAQVARTNCLDTLTASIAHEVKQPLTGAVTNAGICVRLLGCENPNIDVAREAARRAIRDIHRASEVMSRLRALFSRRQTGTELVDLNDATREALALLRRELIREHVTVRLDLADDLPLVTGDRVQLQQVISNLVRNAHEALRDVGDRRREITVKTVADGCAVQLSVADNGAGLDPQMAARVFDPYFTTKQDGMGLGLAVSRSIVESHRGKLWLAANDGPGVTFLFSIPSKQEDFSHEPGKLA